MAKNRRGTIVAFFVGAVALDWRRSASDEACGRALNRARGPGQLMARFSLLPTDDREQRIRFRRYLIAAGTSLMVVVLLGVCVATGILDAGPFAIAAGFVLAFITTFYALFRSGVNQRFGDPSLTIQMMLAAICVVSYALYYLGAMRPSFLIVYPMIMFFGVLRLGTRSLLLVAAFIVTVYALVVKLLAEQPSGLDSTPTEMLRGLVLAAVLVWFSFMGGYVHELRKRLHESGYDPLTGVHTRGRILDVLTHEKIRFDRGADPSCVCLLDLDQFKSINDTLGHRAGDLALRSVAQVARAELRAIDFIGRYGGDEFLLVLVQTRLDGARECVERIRRRIAQSDWIGTGTSQRVTVSSGVTELRPGESLPDTLQRADAALYRAKTAGRNCIESD
jgi:diguanylate cyclase